MAQDLDQARFNPDVITVWHKLGVPQGVGRLKKFRDSRINRKGTKPGKERKPPLKRIADPEFLAEGAPEGLLKEAAKIKQDQDLAPQKLKALKYIESIGCSCYNKKSSGKIEKVIVAAMEDCSAEVRIAAMQLVLSNVGNKCSCQGQCETCCSKGIVKKLKEVAFKMKPNGCYVEPNQQVRSLAEKALMQCPEIMEEPDDEGDEEEPPTLDDEPSDLTDGEEDLTDGEEDLTDGEEDLTDGEEDLTDGEEDLTDGEEDLTDGEEGLESESPLDSLEPPQPDDFESPQPDDFEGGDLESDDSTTGRSNSTTFRSASATRSFGSAWSDPALNELEIRGVIGKLTKNSLEIRVDFVKPFEIPKNAQVVVALNEYDASFGTVVSSKIGSAIIRVDDYLLITNLRKSKRIKLGVLVTN